MDLPAVAALAPYYGVPADWLGDLLPGIESALIFFHNQTTEKSDGNP
jgi:hypothetical protein